MKYPFAIGLIIIVVALALGGCSSTTIGGLDDYCHRAEKDARL